MKPYLFSAAIVAVVWIWIPTESPVPDAVLTETAKTAHDAGVSFLHLLGEEFEVAATLDAQKAFEHIEDRQVILRRSVLLGPIGNIANRAAYEADGNGEFNQEAFTEAMQQVARGLKSVR